MYYNYFCVNFINNVNNKKKKNNAQIISYKQIERFQYSHNFDQIEL